MMTNLVRRISRTCVAWVRRSAEMAAAPTAGALETDALALEAGQCRRGTPSIGGVAHASASWADCGGAHGCLDGLMALDARFCLVEELTPKLIAPCSCIGSARLVHPECLMLWQRRRQHTSKSCEVCLQSWTPQLEPIDQECWVRGVQTNPRYPPANSDAFPLAQQQAATALMRPGSLIVQVSGSLHRPCQVV
eukprot:6189427-Pleurochrysis_carterae.AAC.4